MRLSILTRTTRPTLFFIFALYSSVIGLLPLSAQAGTALADLAESMEPGTWAPLDTIFPNGVREFFLSSNTSDTHLNYTDSGRWDSIGECLYFYGSGHLAIPVFLRYCAATNTWQHLSIPPWININSDTVWDYTGHAYDGNAMDVDARRHFFHRNGDVFRYNLNSGQWDELPSSKSSKAQALEYFPGLGLLALDAKKSRVLRYDENNQDWSAVAGDVLDNTYHNFAEYSPVHDVMLFGGGNGSRKIWLLNADGSVQRGADAPVVMSVINNDTGGLVTADPATGEFVHLNVNRQLYAYKPDKNRWFNVGSTPVDARVYKLMGVPITSHGVIMYVYSRSNVEHQVWLYKHTPSGCAKADTIFCDDVE